MPRNGLTRFFMALLALVVLAVGAIPGLPSMTATAATTLNQSRAGSAACNPSDADWTLVGHNTARVTYNGDATCVTGFGIYNTNGYSSLNEPGAYQTLFGPAKSAVVSPTSRVADLSVPEYDDPECFAQLDVTLAAQDVSQADLYPDPLNAANQGPQGEHLVPFAMTRGSKLCGPNDPPPPPPTCEQEDAEWVLEGHNRAKVTYKGAATCLIGFAAYNTHGFGSLNEPGAYQTLFGPPASAIVSSTKTLVTLTAAGYTDQTCKAQLDVTLSPLGTSLAELYPDPLNAANQGPQGEHLVQPAVTRGERVCGGEEPVVYKQFIMMVMKPAAPPPPPPCSAGRLHVTNTKGGDWTLLLASTSAQTIPPLPASSPTTFTVENYSGTMVPKFSVYEPALQGFEGMSFVFGGGPPGKSFKLFLVTSCGNATVVSSVDP